MKINFLFKELFIWFTFIFVLIFLFGIRWVFNSSGQDDKIPDIIRKDRCFFIFEKNLWINLKSLKFFSHLMRVKASAQNFANPEAICIFVN